MSDDEEAAWKARWRREAQREAFRWARGEPCHLCGEWVGHFGGSKERTRCPVIPLNVPLEEVRPNCSEVLRPRIGDAIRAACDKKGR